MFKKVFSWSLKRREKRVKNDFKGDYFIEKRIYIIEDDKGVFL